MSFLSTLIDGINLGSIYAIMALGYTMVYGIAKMLNFAHGDVIMVGGYVLFELVQSMGVNCWAALAIAMAFCCVLGVAIEAIAYRPLRDATSLAVLITAIGVSYFLQNLVQLIYTSNPKNFSGVIDFGTLSLADGALTIKGSTIFTVGICIVIVVGLVLFMKYSKIGHAMLAVSEDKDAAKLQGINVNMTISITFAIGSALAAIASLCMFTAMPSLYPTAGSLPGIKAFVAAVFGGIGSVPGALVGGVLLGVIENFSKRYISTTLANAIVFVVLIAFLILKPTGIFGKKMNEKV